MHVGRMTEKPQIFGDTAEKTVRMTKKTTKFSTPAADKIRKNGAKILTIFYGCDIMYYIIFKDRMSENGKRTISCCARREIRENDERTESMNKNLLIIGGGIYGAVAKEIAESMGCFDEIAFVDDSRKEAADGTAVIGTCADIGVLATGYPHMVVAIGNPEVRLPLLRKIEKETPCHIATLVSPRAYIAPSAQVMKGCIVEPMAVVHTSAVLSPGCIVSAGAVINHAVVCGEGVHVDCNATVEGSAHVPQKTKIPAGEVFGGSR